jgi:hypothetical protein
MDITLFNCPFCCGPAHFTPGDVTVIQCASCGARGTQYPGRSLETRLHAAQKWNVRGGMGAARISIVDDKVPIETYKLVERLRDTADRIERGQLGSPQQAAVIFFDPVYRTVTVTQLRLGNQEFTEILRAVYQSSSQVVAQA